MGGTDHLAGSAPRQLQRPLLRTLSRALTSHRL
jgi:hypothetical protein